MATVVYNPPGGKGTYGVLGVRFLAGVPMDIETADVLKAIKNEAHFFIDGRPTIQHTLDTSDLRPGEEARIVIPARGFEDKDTAIAFAAEHLPELKLDPNTALKTINTKIIAAWNVKNGEASAEDVAVASNAPAAPAAADSFENIDTGKKAAAKAGAATGKVTV